MIWIVTIYDGSRKVGNLKRDNPVSIATVTKLNLTKSKLCLNQLRKAEKRPEKLDPSNCVAKHLKLNRTALQKLRLNWNHTSVLQWPSHISQTVLYLHNFVTWFIFVDGQRVILIRNLELYGGLFTFFSHYIWLFNIKFHLKWRYIEHVSDQDTWWIILLNWKVLIIWVCISILRNNWKI